MGCWSATCGISNLHIKHNDDVEVCAAETSEQLLTLFNEICACLDGWGIDNTIVQYHLEIEKSNNNKAVIAKTIRKLLDDIKIGSHESFEHGTGFTNIRNM